MRSSLKEAGLIAAEAIQKELHANGCLDSVSCDYLGQECEDHTSHETDPMLWDVASGAWRSQVPVCYLWSLPNGNQLHRGGMRADNVQSRGVPLREVRSLLLRRQLEKAAVASQEQARPTTLELCDVELRCRYSKDSVSRQLLFCHDVLPPEILAICFSVSKK